MEYEYCRKTIRYVFGITMQEVWKQLEKRVNMQFSNVEQDKNLRGAEKQCAQILWWITVLKLYVIKNSSATLLQL